MSADRDLAQPRHPLTDELLDGALEREFRCDYEREQLHRTGQIMSILGVLLLSAFGVVDWLVFGSTSPWVLLRFGVLVPVLLVLFVLTRTRWYPPHHDRVMGAGIFVATLVIGGIGLLGASPGRELYVSAATTLVLFLPAARVGVRGTIATVGAILVVVGAISIASSMAWGVRGYMVLNASSFGLVAFIGARIVESGARTNFLQRRVIDFERHRAEGLLLNVLPAPIAQRLKAGAGVIADSHAEVTVLFADVAGFTPMAAALPPEKLVERLNALFTDLDRLAERHGVEKIKTIGDAYMVAGGVPSPSPRSAEAIAEMALEMVTTVRTVSEGFGQALDIRVGIHTGPAVAGVIGSKKFSYDLWGETVNTASRMESHGLPGRIHVSEAARRRLGEAYAFEERGEIDVKGIGKMRTFFLTQRST